MPEPDDILAHNSSTYHRKQILVSELCGCFRCLAIFSPIEITDWTDSQDTALCPKCGIDPEIGWASGFPVTKAFLIRMNGHWF